MAPAQTSKEASKKESPPDLTDYQDKIDYATFEQILEMDDDEEQEFSKGIVFGFFDQAENTFASMEEALAKNNFDNLSQLGHFLKGSSATLGLTKVKDACEKIQHCKEDLPGEEDESGREKSIEGIKKTLKEVQVDYKEVANILRRFYGEEPVLDDTPDEKKKKTKETTKDEESEISKAEKK